MLSHQRPSENSPIGESLKPQKINLITSFSGIIYKAAIEAVILPLLSYEHTTMNENSMEAHTDPLLDNWYESAFSKDYLTLYAHRSPEEADNHIQLALKYLPFESGQHILDIACGTGRHLLALAKKGAHVTGIDLSNELLDVARASFSASNLKADLQKIDMRNISFNNQFDGATIWFTSFGYFSNPEDDFLVIDGMTKALKPGGWWWIDLPNPAHLRRSLIPESKRIVEGPRGPTTIIEHREIVDNKARKEIKVIDADGTREYTELVRLYTPESFGALVAREPLETLGILGDYHGAPFSQFGERQIWFGIKK